MIRTIRQLLTARRRDLVDNSLDQAKVFAKLAELQAERGAIIDDINKLEERLYED